MTRAATSAPKCLGRARELVTPSLAAAAQTLIPELRRPVEYHWGWIDETGARISGRGGKLLRPALALLSAEAVGKPVSDAIGAATALELVHDFTLLHDDVMDQDRERRGRPTAWTVFGVGVALCAGDALAALAQRVLLADPSPARALAAGSLGQATETVIAGQVLDLSFEGRWDVAVDEYLRMASMKTGALLGCAASLGALIAEGPEESVAALAEFGRSLGLAFQALDDWLGIWGDPKRTGKPVGSDLRQRKASLPILLGAASPSAAGHALRELIAGREPLAERDISRGIDCLTQTGAEAETRALSERELSRALARLGEAALEPAAREALRELAHFVVERDA
jgi:geranylgeranyl diphosphate synthase type I